MRALVTGGAGFIGSNLVDALLARGDAVTVVDDLSTGRRSNLEGALSAGAELAELDIREAAALSELLTTVRPEIVFHLAAQIDVRRSLADPAFDAAINIGGTANLLEAMRTADASRIVFVSTGGAIYGEGEGQQLPLDESTPIAPLSAYGQSKFAAEGYLALYERLYGLSGVSLRLGNVYGPRQDPLGEAGVIAIFCGRLRAGGRPTVFGDGKQTRDYIYGGDVVAAALAAAERTDQHRQRDRDRRARARRPACRDRRRRGLRARARPTPRGRGSAHRARRRPSRARARLAGGDHGRRRITADVGLPLTFAPCTPRPMPARSASASSARGSVTSRACATCSRPPSTSPA